VFQYVDAEVPELNREIPSKLRDRSSADSATANRPLAPDQPDHGRIDDSSLNPAEVQPEREGERNARKQAIDSLNALAASVAGTDSNVPSDIQLIRVQLATTTLLATSLPSSMLGVHEANRLYQSRHSVSLETPELISIARLLITDRSGYVPGWSWLNGIDALAIEFLILNLALTDAYSSVRHAAFHLCASSELPILPEHREAIGRAAKQDSSAEVRRAAVAYLGRAGDPTCRSLISAVLMDPDRSVARQARESQYLFLARTAPDEALSGLLSESGLDLAGC
jgi:hypothetical protein